MSYTAKRVVLAGRPAGEAKLDHFRLEEFQPGEPGPGQVLVRTLWLSLDPYMRTRMGDGISYAKGVEIGEVMEGGAVSEVLVSRDPALAPGDRVVGRTGWQTHAVVNARGVRKVATGSAPASTALGVLGMPGLTAYTGLLDIGQPKPGETVVVASASGAVGSAVGQIARIKGARAVGIAGGVRKCRHVTDVFGFDACVDHRAPDFRAQLAAACPGGIDVYFENVGGPVFEAVFPLLNTFSRIPLCGTISIYDSAQNEAPRLQIPELMRNFLFKRVTLRGFIVSDFGHRNGDFQRDMGAWVTEGRVKYLEDVVEGLEKAPAALLGLLRGENFGKVVVRVAPE